MTDLIDEILGEFRSPRITEFITTRADLLARRAELQDAHHRAVRTDANTNGPKEAPRIFDEIEQIEDEILASRRPVTFEALGRNEYRRLMLKHPPRAEDRKAQLPYNAETFPAALIAACAVVVDDGETSPMMTEAQANDLCERLSGGQFQKLWNAAIAVNVGDDEAPKSVRPSATTVTNGTSSTTAPPEGSPAPSSSGE